MEGLVVSARAVSSSALAKNRLRHGALAACVKRKSPPAWILPRTEPGQRPTWQEHDDGEESAHRLSPVLPPLSGTEHDLCELCIS